MKTHLAQKHHVEDAKDKKKQVTILSIADVSFHLPFFQFLGWYLDEANGTFKPVLLKVGEPRPKDTTPKEETVEGGNGHRMIPDAKL